MDETDIDGNACDDNEMDGDDEEYEFGQDGVDRTILLCNSLNNSSKFIFVIGNLIVYFSIKIVDRFVVKYRPLEEVLYIRVVAVVVLFPIQKSKYVMFTRSFIVRMERSSSSVGGYLWS